MLVTTFRPFVDYMQDGYDHYVYVDNSGKVSVKDRKELEGKTGSFSALTRLPLEYMEFDNKGRVRLTDSPDMSNKMIYLKNNPYNDVNSGIGVGKDLGEWASLDELNKYSFLNGGKALFRTKSGESYVVAGSAKDLIDVFNNIKKQQNGLSPDVFKLDNGSFNLPIRGQNEGVFTKDDLRKHYLRNEKGGHGLVLKKNGGVLGYGSIYNKSNYIR